MKSIKELKNEKLKDKVHNREEHEELEEAGSKSAEQKTIASIKQQLDQEPEFGREGSEKVRILELKFDELKKNLQRHEEAWKEEDLVRQTTHSKISDQLLQLPEGRAKQTALEREVVDLVSSEYDLQQEVKQLTSQLEKTKQQAQATLDESLDTLTCEFEVELGERQTTIVQLKEVEDLQEELTWYKDKLRELRKKYRDDMEACYRKERERFVYILGAYGEV